MRNCRREMNAGRVNGAALSSMLYGRAALRFLLSRDHPGPRILAEINPESRPAYPHIRDAIPVGVSDVQDSAGRRALGPRPRRRPGVHGDGHPARRGVGAGVRACRSRRRPGPAESAIVRRRSPGWSPGDTGTSSRSRTAARALSSASGMRTWAASSRSRRSIPTRPVTGRPGRGWRRRRACSLRSSTRESRPSTSGARCPTAGRSSPCAWSRGGRWPNSWRRAPRPAGWNPNAPGISASSSRSAGRSLTPIGRGSSIAT